VNKRYFYIVALPRSRTVWLSHYFTNGYSRCFHDILSVFSPHAEFLLCSTNLPFMGSCDTTPESWIEQSKPPGRVAVIYRDPAESMASFLKAFDTPEGFTPDGWREGVARFYDRQVEILEALRGRVFWLDYDKLSDDDALDSLHRYLMPGTTPDITRTKVYQLTRIELFTRDLTPGLRAIAANQGLDYDKFCNNFVRKGGR